MDVSDYLSIKQTVTVDHALDGQSKTAYITTVCAVSIVLSTLAVLARLYTRVCVLHTFGRDDFVMAVAQAFTILTAVAILVGAWAFFIFYSATNPPPPHPIPLTL